MPSLAHVRLIAMAVAAVVIAGCASAATSTQSANAGVQATDSRSVKTPQLPKSYPCQNLHVKTLNCPPR
jgi:uncharacterized lipoprotein